MDTILKVVYKAAEINFLLGECRSRPRFHRSRIWKRAYSPPRPSTCLPYCHACRRLHIGSLLTRRHCIGHVEFPAWFFAMLYFFLWQPCALFIPLSEKVRCPVTANVWLPKVAVRPFFLSSILMRVSALRIEDHGGAHTEELLKMIWLISHQPWVIDIFSSTFIVVAPSTEEGTFLQGLFYTGEDWGKGLSYDCSS